MKTVKMLSLNIDINPAFGKNTIDALVALTNDFMMITKTLKHSENENLSVSLDLIIIDEAKPWIGENI
jgi:5-bromo-4-chloroindolyl phosphate hydrolysis protein